MKHVFHFQDEADAFLFVRDKHKHVRRIHNDEEKGMWNITLMGKKDLIKTIIKEEMVGQ